MKQGFYGAGLLARIGSAALARPFASKRFLLRQRLFVKVRKDEKQERRASRNAGT